MLPFFAFCCHSLIFFFVCYVFHVLRGEKKRGTHCSSFVYVSTPIHVSFLPFLFPLWMVNIQCLISSTLWSTLHFRLFLYKWTLFFNRFVAANASWRVKRIGLQFEKFSISCTFKMEVSLSVFTRPSIHFTSILSSLSFDLALPLVFPLPVWSLHLPFSLTTSLLLSPLSRSLCSLTAKCFDFSRLLPHSRDESTNFSSLTAAHKTCPFYLGNLPPSGEETKRRELQDL